MYTIIILILLGMSLGIMFFYSVNLSILMIALFNIEVDMLLLMIIGITVIFIISTSIMAKVKSFFKKRKTKFKMWIVYSGWFLSVLLIVVVTPELRMSGDDLGSHVYMKAGGYFFIGLSFAQLTLSHLFSNLMVKKGHENE